MKAWLAKHINLDAYGLSLVVSAIALVAWWQDFHGSITITAYSLFPLLGLLAFSLMWTHYIVGAKRRWLGVPKEKLKTYRQVTGWLVLILICLHPGLLIWQLFADGFGLPPGSYLENYVAPGLKWAALLGTVSFLIFLAFESKRWFYKKDWWRFVEYANVAAMFAILVHSLSLGSTLQRGWLRGVWYFYGVSLAVSLAVIYLKKESAKIGQTSEH